jgi:hypothetical protein
MTTGEKGTVLQVSYDLEAIAAALKRGAISCASSVARESGREIGSARIPGRAMKLASAPEINGSQRGGGPVVTEGLARTEKSARSNTNGPRTDSARRRHHGGRREFAASWSVR